MKYGYARVSSTTQDYAAQVDALKAAGCEHIFSEKQSGKNRDGRPEFGKLMKALLPGDVVVVAKLDRLVRSPQGLAQYRRNADEAASELLRKGFKRTDITMNQR
jgi:DNA invertase Pin-like site-specific DNA recombinase